MSTFILYNDIRNVTQDLNRKGGAGTWEDLSQNLSC